MIYLLHSTVALQRGNGQQVAHYLGTTEPANLLRRLEAHQQGHGAVLTREFVKRGGDILLVRWWTNGGREAEVRQKLNGHLAMHCPLCVAGARQADKLVRVARARRKREQQQTQLPLPLPGSGGALQAPNTITATTPVGPSQVRPRWASGTTSGVGRVVRSHGGRHSTATALPSPVAAT